MALVIIMVGALGFSTAAAATVETDQQAQFVAPIMVVNASFLNIRTGPGVEFTVLTTVVGGTELPVLGVARDRVWYQVSTLAGVGWVNSQFTLPRGNFTNVPFVEAPPITGTIAPSTTGTGITVSSDDAVFGFGGGRAWGISITETHPFRTQPTINSGSPGNISSDTTVIFTVLAASTGDGVVWYQINTRAFGTGWVEGTKAMFRPFACELSAVVFVTSAAPILGPDGSGTLDGNMRVEAGSEAYLLDAVGTQYKVELIDGNTGWVPTTVVSIREGVRSAYCDGGGTDGAAVNPGQGGGGVVGTQTAPVQPALEGPRVVINTGFLNIRSGPGNQYTVITSVPGGTVLRVIGFAPDGVWYLVEGTFGQGWLNSDFTLFRGSGRGVPIIRNATGLLSTPVATITNAVTLYATPSLSSAIVGALSGPLQVNVVARSADFNWVQLSTSIGFGWVQASQVSLGGDTNLIPVISG
jgi:uncharacterized protein YraI